MDLVERYIAAVKFWLPAAGKDDIAAELAEDIRCEIEEAERQKGHKLSDDEVSDLLKARGAPLTVASRFLPQRHLIGPEIMPVYLFVLKIVAAICLLPLVAAWIAGPFVDLDNSPAHLLTAPAGNLLTAFAVVTIIFAIIEYKGIIPAKSQSWNPKNLPPVHATGRIKRADSIADITASLVLLWVFFAGYLSRYDYWGPTSHVVLSPVWVPYWQVMLALVLAETSLCAVNLFHPVWTAPKALFRMLIDLGKTAALFWLLQSHFLRLVTILHVSEVQTAKLITISDRLAEQAETITVVLTILIVLTALRRTYRAARQHTVVKTPA
jgi:hypothetical protein